MNKATLLNAIRTYNPAYKPEIIRKPTKAELYTTAKKMNIHGRSRMNKADLLIAINDPTYIPPPTTARLYVEAKQPKIHGMNKREVIDPAQLVEITRLLKKEKPRKTGGAINDNFQTFRIDVNEVDIVKAFELAKPQMLGIITSGKLQIRFAAEFYRAPSDGTTEYNIFYNGTPNKIIQPSTDIDAYLNEYRDERYLTETDGVFDLKFQVGSGWVFSKILYFEIRTAPYDPLAGSSYIDLPPYLKNKKAIINVKNEDQQCFKWALLSALHPVDRDAERVSKYKQYDNELNFEGIQFPVDVKKIPKFERQNNISVNLVGYSDNKMSILHSSKKKYDKSIDLIIINEDEKNHYCWIKSYSRFMGAADRHRTYWCRNCHAHFYSEEKLEIHKQLCYDNKEAIIEIPKEKTIKFKNVQFTEYVPYVIYADFESTLYKINTCIPNPHNPYTVETQSHVPNSFCYAVVYEGRIVRQKLYRGDDAAKVFVKDMETEVDLISQEYHKNCPINGPTADSDKCTYCKCEFTDANPKVMHHNHLKKSNNFIAVLCNNCNLKCKLPKFVPVYFHNMSGYDSHLFVKELAYDDLDIKIIPQNSEKYISISKVVKHERNYKGPNGEDKVYKRSIDIRFLDTFKFMASSLDKLAKNLTDEQMTITSSEYKGEDFKLLRQKGIYPYDYMDSTDRFLETELPAKDKFYSTLYDETVTDDQYEFAKAVWKNFRCKTLGDYHDLYLKTDVLLLADIFENFRKTCLTAYGLDPSWCYTTPGLAWQAMLKVTGVELDILDDVAKILFMERGIRGGLSNALRDTPLPTINT